jgi:uncharacterized protein
VKRYDFKNMSTFELPKFIEPLKFCQKAGKGGKNILAGQLDIGQSLAIGELLEGQGKPNQSVLVQAEIIFGQDQTGFNLITGQLHSQVKLCCQRCLALFDYSIDIELSLSPISSEKELDNLPDYVEPLMLDAEGQLVTSSWLAEELHLALPMVPKHENSEMCHLTLPKGVTLE